MDNLWYYKCFGVFFFKKIAIYYFHKFLYYAVLGTFECF